jgi:hypothetical protein
MIPFYQLDPLRQAFFLPFFIARDFFLDQNRGAF